MRDAAIRAGLVPDAASAQERIEFVSEGEASFHWCVDTGLATGALTVRTLLWLYAGQKVTVHSHQKGSEIVVADAGGGTIDVTSFRVTGLKPLQLKEAAAAECEQHDASTTSITNRCTRPARRIYFCNQAVHRSGSR